MRMLPILLGGLLTSSLGLAFSQGAEKPKTQEDKPIATVLGKPIYLKDLKLDENDKTDLRDYFAIAGLVVSPLRDKYIKKHRLAATPMEIKEFRDWSAAQSLPDLTDSGLSAEELKAIEDQNELAKQPGTDESKAFDEIPKWWVEGWKFNLALYEKYGGRVIFQQAGLEPLDATRDWLRDEEKAGNFQIHDKKWRDAFWEYYKDRYHRFFDDPDLIKVPHWRMARNPNDDPAPQDDE